MALFAVKRIINGIHFLKDEDRIIAGDWDTATDKLIQGSLSGKYDETCVLDGIIVYEEEIPDDMMLDIMLDQKLL